MVNKLTIFAVLVVALSVVSAIYGLPAAQSTADREELMEVETTTAKSGYRGWIKGVYDKIRRPCNHTHEGGRGVVHWVKSKLGFVKPTTTAAPTTTTVADSKDGGRPDIESPGVETPSAETPGVETPETSETGEGRRPETGDEGAAWSPSYASENGRPNTDSGDESVDGTPLPPPSVDESDANGFSDEDLTPLDTVTVIDPRIDARMGSSRKPLKK